MRHNFGIAVLIIDGVVVTCWMVLCDFAIERTVSRKVLVISVSSIELRSFAYSLFELYCLRRFSFFWALGFSGLALKVAGVFFCRDDVRVVMS